MEQRLKVIASCYYGRRKKNKFNSRYKGYAQLKKWDGKDAHWMPAEACDIA